MGTSKVRFPLEFPYKRIFSKHLASLDKKPFLVCAMFTAGYEEQAERLIASCKRWDLPCVLYDVPEVHQSISPKGGSNLCFTKPNFIHYVIEAFRKPVLYLDVDCYFSGYPEKIESLAEEGFDFAVYNWLADEHTAAYIPVTINLQRDQGTRVFQKRYYRFSHSIDVYTKTQLMCSGATQFYSDTPQARKLLVKWHEIITAFPNSADDQCLDYVFNNFIVDQVDLKPAWLEKSYTRYAWWIYIRPIINHPDFPYSGDGFVPVPEQAGMKRFYPERAHRLSPDFCFPRDCLIDPEEKLLLRMLDGKIVPVGEIKRKLWL